MSPSRPRNPDETAFLEAYDAARFPHPSVAVDVALISIAAGALRALVVRRDEHPFRGRFALPGGFVGMDESLDAAASRVLGTKAGLDRVFLEQLYTFGAPDRDPRTRVITVAYYALIPPERLEECHLEGGGRTGSIEVPWQGEVGGAVHLRDEDGHELPLAFDHGDILGLVVQRMRGKLDYAPIGFELLPRQFTLRRLQDVHETILGRHLNKDSFRRRILATGLLAETGRREEGARHRPAALYRFSTPASRPPEARSNS